MTQSSKTGGTQSVVAVGAAQRGDSGWPKPGDEGFVHPDGTEQSVLQMRDNQRAAADRDAAGSTVHGAPALGGVQPVPAVTQDPSELAKAQAEHTVWVYEAHDALAEEENLGRHEATSAPTSPKSPDSKTA